jgi:hypothetical protein
MTVPCSKFLYPALARTGPLTDLDLPTGLPGMGEDHRFARSRSIRSGFFKPLTPTHSDPSDFNILIPHRNRNYTWRKKNKHHFFLGILKNHNQKSRAMSELLCEKANIYPFDLFKLKGRKKINMLQRKRIIILKQAINCLRFFMGWGGGA